MLSILWSISCCMLRLIKKATMSWEKDEYMPLYSENKEYVLSHHMSLPALSLVHIYGYSCLQLQKFVNVVQLCLSGVKLCFNTHFSWKNVVFLRLLCFTHDTGNRPILIKWALLSSLTSGGPLGGLLHSYRNIQEVWIDHITFRRQNIFLYRFFVLINWYYCTHHLPHA